MTYFNGMFYHFKSKNLLKGRLTSKKCITPFSRESFKVFEYVLTQGFVPTMSISKSVLHIHWLPMFLHLFNTFFEKLHEQTKLRNLCPKTPQVSSSDTCILPYFFTWFSIGATGPKQPIKSTKSKFATTKVGEPAKSEV